MAKIKTSKGDIYFRQKFLFPGCHQINRQIAFDNLCVINSVLAEKSIYWGAVYGTLLGIYRDGDFIEWDEDTDLYILEEEEELFKGVICDLIKAGFELIRYERAGLYSFLRNGEYVDFYVLNKLSDEIRLTSDGGLIFERFIKERSVFDFKGQKIYVPKDIEEFLSFQYGEWQKPVRFFPPKVGAYKLFVNKLYWYFRLYSPGFLYYWWLKRLRIKIDLPNFKLKCQKKGYSFNENFTMEYHKLSKSRDLR